MEDIIDMVCTAHKGRHVDTIVKYFVYWETTRGMQIKDKSTVTKGQNFRLGSALWFLTDGTAVIYSFHNRINSDFPSCAVRKMHDGRIQPETYNYVPSPEIVSTVL